MPHLHLLTLALVLICILTLPLLVSGAILGIVPSVTASETPIVIALVVLLLLLLRVASGWVPTAAAVAGSPIAPIAAEVSCFECRTQS